MRSVLIEANVEAKLENIRQDMFMGCLDCY